MKTTGKGTFRLRAVAAAISALLLSPTVHAEAGCPTGYVPDGNEKLADVDFSQGYAGFTTDIPKKFAIGTYPQDGSPYNTTAYPNTAISIIDGDVAELPWVSQAAFPGDSSPGGGLPAVPAIGRWLAYNGNDSGAPSKIWEQQVTGLEANATYAFTAYFSNALAPGQQAQGLAAPQVVFKVDGVQQGLPVAVCDAGGGATASGDCENEAGEDRWQRFGASFTTDGGGSATVSIHDAQKFVISGGNDFAMTALSLQKCVPIGTPDIDVGSTSVVFSGFVVGGTPVSRTITVTNKGTGNLVIGTIPALAGGDFTITSDNCSGKSLAPSASCSLVVAFSRGTDGASNGSLSIPSNDGDENPLVIALKGRTGIDSDGDGVLDAEDIDDDNDGILDVDEGDGDFDGDGVPNRLDLDSDNDSLPDIVEALGTDADNDGRVDGFTDANGDGFHDALVDVPWPRPDTDGDGAHDHLDVDSDNDGKPDLIEIGGLDADGNGRVDDFSDADGDGWDRARFTGVLGDNGSMQDLDGDGTPDYRQAEGKVLTDLEGGLGGIGLLPLLLPLLRRRFGR